MYVYMYMYIYVCVYYVLCIMYYVLCNMYYVLCIMYYVYVYVYVCIYICIHTHYNPHFGYSNRINWRLNSTVFLNGQNFPSRFGASVQGCVSAQNHSGLTPGAALENGDLANL